MHILLNSILLLIEPVTEISLIYIKGSKSLSYIVCYFHMNGITLDFNLRCFIYVFKAEFTAIQKTITYIFHDRRLSLFIICIDSKSALDALKSCSWNNSYILVNLQFLKKVNFCDFNITFCWVSWHMDIAVNEKTDMASKQGCRVLPLKTVRFHSVI